MLNELEKMNVITVRTFGKSYAFRLNQNGYAITIVERAFELEERTLLELKKTLKERLEVPEAISAGCDKRSSLRNKRLRRSNSFHAWS